MVQSFVVSVQSSLSPSCDQTFEHLMCFECSWALFKAGGYRNAYPYLYLSLSVILTCGIH